MKKSDPTVPSCSGGKGNTKPSPAPSTISPAVRWAFTLNNFTPEDQEVIQCSIKKHCRMGCYNIERGENNTPHLQGYIEFNKKNRPFNVFGIKQIHWEKAKGNREQNVEYCSKDCDGTMTFEHGEFRPAQLKVIKNLRHWQSVVKSYIEFDWKWKDDRTIHWIVDRDGCAGKTAFCKYLYSIWGNKVMIITGGGYKDIACVLKMKQEDKTFDINKPFVVMFNIPRDADDNGIISYKALESLKDGLITSTKYESATMVFNSPSVWVFSNNEPEIDKLSKDRWRVYNIKNGELRIKETEQHQIFELIDIDLDEWEY